MASFTETATLRVIDDSTAQIKKINSALKSLMNTAKQLKSVSAKIDVKTTGLAQASKMIGKTAQDMKNLRSMAANVRVRADTTQAQNALRRLQQQANQITATIRSGGGGAGGGGRGGGTRGSGGVVGIAGAGHGVRGAARSVAQGFSSGLGLGIPLSGPPALMALEAAAYGAAKALKFVASATMERDRAKLLAAVGATPEQRAVLEADANDLKKDRGPLPLSRTQRLIQQTNLLSNVAGITGADRAKAAINLSDYIEKELLPRQFALNPQKSFDEVQEGVRTLVKGLDVVATGLVNTEDKFDKYGNMIAKRGQISEEGMRAIKGLQLAQVAEPDIPANLVKTVSANLKSLAYTISPEAYAKVLVSANVRGVRAANELYRAQQALAGRVDVKKFNQRLEQSGLVKDFERQGKKLMPGTGKVVDAALLQTDPYTWINKHLRPLMEQAIGKDADQEAQTRWVENFMAGSSTASRQGVIDALVNDQQQRQTISNAVQAIEKNNVPEAMQKSLTAQLQNIHTALTDRASMLGDSAAAQMGIPDMLRQLAVAIQDPKGAAARELLTSGMDKVFKALDAPLLEVAARALTGSAVDLTAAAFKLMGLEPPVRKPEEQTARDVKEIEAQRKRIEIGEREAKDAQAFVDQRAGKVSKAEMDKAKKQIVDAQKKIEEAKAKIAELEAGITARSTDQMKKDAATAAEVASYDLAVNSEAKTMKDKADADAERERAKQKRWRELDAQSRRRDASLTKKQRKAQEDYNTARYGSKVPMPMARPDFGLPGGNAPTGLPPVQPLDDVKPPLPTIEENLFQKALREQTELLDRSGTKMTDAAKAIDTSSGNFKTAFDGGAEKLSTAGKTAVSDMEGGAASIGAKIAAAFVAGASGVKVGVDMSGVTQAKATNTGTLDRTVTT